jgi:hypothetical protein
MPTGFGSDSCSGGRGGSKGGSSSGGGGGGGGGDGGADAGATRGRKKSGIVRAKFPVTVQVDDQEIVLSVPHNYATNGWLLREACAKYGANVGKKASKAALRRSDGSYLDLSKEIVKSVNNAETVEAVDEQTAIAGNAGAAALRNAAATDTQDTFERYGMTSYQVCVVIGDEVYELNLPSLDMPMSWVISETIRRYMAANDDQDPGILGLQTVEGNDLDLGEDVVAVVASGESINAVSYTVKSKAGMKGHTATVSAAKKQQDKEQKEADTPSMGAKMAAIFKKEDKVRLSPRLPRSPLAPLAPLLRSPPCALTHRLRRRFLSVSLSLSLSLSLSCSLRPPYSASLPFPRV